MNFIFDGRNKKLNQKLTFEIERLRQIHAEQQRQKQFFSFLQLGEDFDLDPIKYGPPFTFTFPYPEFDPDDFHKSIGYFEMWFLCEGFGFQFKYASIIGSSLILCSLRRPGTYYGQSMSDCGLLCQDHPCKGIMITIIPQNNLAVVTTLQNIYIDSLYFSRIRISGSNAGYDHWGAILNTMSFPSEEKIEDLQRFILEKGLIERFLLENLKQ